MAVTAWMVVRRSKVCRPRPPLSRSAKASLYLLQHPLVCADRLADDEFGGVFQRLANRLAPGHLTHARASVVGGQDQQVAREERAVGSAQVQQHAVAAGDRNHPSAVIRGVDEGVT